MRCKATARFDPTAILFAQQHPEVGQSEAYLNELQINLATSTFSNLPFLSDCVGLFS